MAQFDLKHFLECPSLDQLELCRKDDLSQIATHFSISCPKQLLKTELKNLVVERLVELKLIEFPEPSVAQPSVSATVPSAGPSEGGRKAVGKTQAVSHLPEVTKVSEGIETPYTLPRVDLSVGNSSAGSKAATRLKVRLARLQLEAQEKAQHRQFQLDMKRLEIEADTTVRLRQLELQTQAAAHVSAVPVNSTNGSVFSSDAAQNRPFDVARYVALVPEFREAEVDCYFSAFERIAQALQWPSEVWTILLQCKIKGKAQEVVASLPLVDTLDYEKVKAAILKAYELVPEAYRQRFRAFKKSPSQTYVEFT
ncbi:uncharacterized protein LOC106536648, partial [Austrofundulus limnaeus]|uniref:Uncharacterized protein LOC106536648 n=1 Tax=Austrofundulus limnaeus TaxID=52670 RepID=A0A2I4DAZ5_AUSLI